MKQVLSTKTGLASPDKNKRNVYLIYIVIFILILFGVTVAYKVYHYNKNYAPRPLAPYPYEIINKTK